MNEERRDRSEALDLYLDGLLEGEALAAFERRLAEDRDLAAEVERHRALEARLRRSFAPPDDVEAIARRALSAPKARPRPAAGWRPGVPVRIAAAVLIFIGLGVWIRWWVSSRTPGTDGPIAVKIEEPEGVAGLPALALARIYDEISRRVKPGQGGCSDEDDLAPHFADRYGSELCLNVRSDLPVQGPFPCESWCKSWPSVTVLAGVAGLQPILILVDSAETDPLPSLEPESPLQIHRRDLGDLVIYEVSPLPESRCLDMFYFCSAEK